MDRQQEFVMRTIEERDIRFIRLWFTDVVGTLKSVALAPAEVESAFEEGLGFDGSSIEGLSRVYESDMLLQPDPSTFQILPWRGAESHTSRMFCDILTPDGEASASDTRGVLKRTLNRAAEMGFTCYTSPEIEFYLLKSTELGADGFPVPVDYESYFDHTPGGIVQDFRRNAVTMLEEVGISVEFSHHETGPGQNEIDLRHADALQTADNVMTFRTVIKEVAFTRNMYATFMPKPFTKYAGSGMHTHFSLFEGDTNAFFEAGAEYRLSKTGRHFIAGVLKHAPEFTAVTNQFINSYKRVPLYKPNKMQSARIEYRGLDSASNPYLAYAVILSAGLKGIENEYELMPAVTEDLAAMTTAERRAMGYHPLPASLREAINLTEDSEFMAEVLGEQVFEHFLRNKRADWEDYRAQVTPYELKHNLGIL